MLETATPGQDDSFFLEKTTKKRAKTGIDDAGQEKQMNSPESKKPTATQLDRLREARRLLCEGRDIASARRNSDMAESGSSSKESPSVSSDESDEKLSPKYDKRKKKTPNIDKQSVLKAINQEVPKEEIETRKGPKNEDHMYVAHSYWSF